MKIFKISAPILVPLVLVLNVVSGLSIVEKDGSDALVVDPEIPEQIATVEVEEQGGSARQEAAKEEPVPVKYDGAQLWRVDYDDQDKRNAVAELQDKFEASMWNYNVNSSVDVFLPEPQLTKARQFLSAASVPFEVVIDDMQRAIDEENPSKDQLDLWENRDGHRMTWTAYHRLADIHEWMDYLADTYPQLCSTRTIGKSHQGRDLKVLRISNGNPANAAIWMDGGIHAREWISPATVTYLVNALVEEWDDQPEHMRNVDWYVLPVHNPDGYEYTQQYDRLWRKNRRSALYGPCSGVDLNRNYGYKWGGQGSSKQPCSDIYAGSGPFSEPETKAVFNFMQSSAANWKGFLTFHSYGQYILYPWGYDRVVPPDHEDLKRVGDEAAQRMRQSGGQSYTVGPSGNTLYPASGGSDDWARGEMNIKYAYTVELRDSGRNGFVLPASEIIPTGKESALFIDTIASAVAKLK
ncbi:carboxypeptidase B [Culex quinquefasciatus]|uniref:carboxypeptidase B n=1 Tax=Culex quinquefasciatus TaxID=7176 RepID=UPI0018E3C6EB|nr:carboxypeptidase B [Culex quinquefasciatus]